MNWKKYFNLFTSIQDLLSAPMTLAPKTNP